MEMKLTYDGLLLGASRTSTRAQHKHDIRRQFHPQLKRFWQTHPVLKQARTRQFLVGAYNSNLNDDNPPLWESLAQRFGHSGYNFVPLARTEDMLV